MGETRKSYFLPILDPFNKSKTKKHIPQKKSLQHLQDFELMQKYDKINTPFERICISMVSNGQTYKRKRRNSLTRF